MVNRNRCFTTGSPGTTEFRVRCVGLIRAMSIYFQGKVNYAFFFSFRLMFTALASSSVKCAQEIFQFWKVVKSK